VSDRNVPTPEEPVGSSHPVSTEFGPAVNNAGIEIVKEAVLHHKPGTPGLLRLWNRDFVLLWQGQLVSELGNVAFNIALGFWVLAVTGSTAKMGLVLAVFALPWLLVTPFAGVYADRANRRSIIIITDFIRGVAMVAMALLIIFKIFPFWLIIPIGLLIGTCGSFFMPALNSAIPDIVPQTQLIRANSLRSLTSNFVNMVGTALGGIVYSLVGAPVLFLFDGLTFLVTSVAELFVRIPKVQRSEHKAKLTYFEDLKDGFRFMLRFAGLRFILIEAVALNFFLTIGSILLTPFFMKMSADGQAAADWAILQQTDIGKAFLENIAGSGAMLYGFAAGSFVLGNFIGAGITAIAQIKPRHRAFSVALTGLLGCFAMIGVGQIKTYIPILFLMATAGICVAVALTLLNTTMQTSVPQDMRGKTFGLLAAAIGASSPLAMAVGGVVGEYAGAGVTISLAFVLGLLISLPLAFAKNVHAMINFDPETQSLDDILHEQMRRSRSSSST
jgi:MFS family permease